MPGDNEPENGRNAAVQGLKVTEPETTVPRRPGRGKNSQSMKGMPKCYLSQPHTLCAVYHPRNLAVVGFDVTPHGDSFAVIATSIIGVISTDAASRRRVLIMCPSPLMRISPP